MRWVVPVCVGLATLVFVGCDEVQDVTGGATPAVVEAVTSTSQEGGVGTTITLSVRVLDQDSAGIEGIPVLWSASAGTVDPDTSSTDGSGETSTAWTLGGAAGDQELTATVEGVGSVSFTATALAGPVDSLTASLDSLTLTALDDTAHLSVAATDSFGNAVPAGASWTSRDEAVATVDGEGVVTAVGNGAAWLVADANGASDSVKARVAQEPASIRVDAGPARVLIDDTVRATAVVADANGYAIEGVAPSWSSTGALLSSAGSGAFVGMGVGVNGAVASLDDVLADTGDVMITPRPEDALAAGNGHVCALDETGTAYCWGGNSWGQLGIGSMDTLRHAAPEMVQGGHTFKALRVADHTSCGIQNDGTAYCWGRNRSGYGNGDTIDAAVPTLAAGGMTFADLDIGGTGNVGCGLQADGTVYCWGVNGEGQLGTGDTIWQFNPVPVAQGDLSFDQLSVGLFNSCALTADGTAYCWGDNGLLGVGTTSDASADVLSPTPVQGSLTFQTIQVGATTTCGVASDGATYCWGVDFYGSLGTGASSGVSGSSVPTAIVGANPFVRAGEGPHNSIFAPSCGIEANGDVYCWGSGAFGALGTGATVDACGPLTSDGQEFPCSGTPVLVQGGLSFTAVSGAAASACAVDAQGRLHCWGRNNVGQLGTETAETCTVYTEAESCATAPVLVDGSLQLPIVP
jgi:alpha-tubulin suppressor-like RCC1 family protein